MKPYSLRRRLLLWLLMATAVLGLVALIDTWREALRTAQSVSDRVLAGSGYPRILDLLAGCGCRVVALDNAAIGAIDAGFTCMSLRWRAAQD